MPPINKAFENHEKREVKYEKWLPVYSHTTTTTTNNMSLNLGIRLLGAFKTLRAKLCITLAVAMLICLVVQGLVFAFFLAQIDNDKAFTTINDRLSLGVLELSKTLDEAERNVRFLAQLAGVRSALLLEQPMTRGQLENILLRLAAGNPRYREIRVISAANPGPEIIRIERLNNAPRKVPSRELQEKYQREYFQRTLELSWGQVHVSAFEVQRELNQFGYSLRPLVRVSSPVFDSQESTKIIGMVVINIDAQRVFNAMQKSLPEHMKLYVATSDGHYLYPAEKLSVSAGDRGGVASIVEDFAAVQHLLWGVEDSIKAISKQRTRGSAELHLFRRIHVGGEDAKKWIVVGAALMQQGFFAAAQRQWRQSLGLMAALATSILLIVWWFIARLMQPINQMRHEIDGFRRLDENLHLPTARSDEVGALARSISAMDKCIHEQFDELRQQKERVDSMIHTAVDAIVQVDDNGVIEFWNAAAENMFGYRAKEVVGKNFKVLMAKSYVSKNYHFIKLYLNSGVARTRDVGHKLMARKKNGKVFPVHLSIGEYHVADKRKFTGIIYDATKQTALEEKLRRLASSDGLTGIYNHRAFSERAVEEVGRAHRQNSKVSLLLIDIDNFKKINDIHGHRAGDCALRYLVNTARDTLRQHDIIGRIGGDEFAVILPDTAVHDAHLIGDRMLEALMSGSIGADYDQVCLSVSVGLAELDPQYGEGYDRLFARADEMLYVAKGLGKGRLVSDLSDTGFISRFLREN